MTHAPAASKKFVAPHRRHGRKRKRPALPQADEKYGAGEGNRTPDRLITNQLLYRLSYASHPKTVIIVEK